MIRSHLRPIALTLAVAVLLMLGVTTGISFAHEIQHAAHHVTAFTLNEDTALPFLSGLRSFVSCSTLQARAPPVLL